MGEDIPVRDVADGGWGGMAAAVEEVDVGVDVFLTAVELAVEAALGVGDWGDVEDDGFPLEGAAPQEGAEAEVEGGAGVDEEFHDGAAVVAIAVDGVKEGGVAADAVVIDGGGGVDRGAGMEERGGAAERVVFGAEVEG